MPATLDRELRRLLTRASCTLVRMGKGSHEIWHNPVTKRRLPVPVGIVSRHTANGILVQAGLPKAFCSGWRSPQRSRRSWVLTAQGGTSLVISTPAARGHSERLSFAALRDGAPDFFRGSPACRVGRYRAG